VTISAQRPEIEDAAIFLHFGDDTESDFPVVFVVIRRSSSNTKRTQVFLEIVSYEQDQFRGIQTSAEVMLSKLSSVFRFWTFCSRICARLSGIRDNELANDRGQRRCSFGASFSTTRSNLENRYS